MPEHAVGCNYWSTEGSPLATCSCGLWRAEQGRVATRTGVLTCSDCREQYTDGQLCTGEGCPKVACRGELYG